MNLSRRHAFMLGGSIAAAATLAACVDDRPVVTNVPTAPPGPKPKLTQWYQASDQPGIQDAVTTHAASYPAADITVEWRAGDYAEQLGEALQGTSAPDVFESEYGPTLDMIAKGEVLDLTALMAPLADQFNPSIMERFTHQDKIWAVPQTIDVEVLYYRPSMLQEAGLEPPATLTDLIEAARALKTEDMAGFYAGEDGGLETLGTLIIWASGNEQLNDDRTEAGFINESFTEAVVAFRDFYNSGDMLQGASDTWTTGLPLINGETAMQWGRLSSLGEITEALGDDVGVLPFPAIGEDGRPAVPIHAFGACVSAKSTEPDAATALVRWQWVDDLPSQIEFAGTFGTRVPAKLALVAQTAGLGSGPGAAAAQAAAQNGFAPDIAWNDALQEAYDTALTDIVFAMRDPTTALKTFGEFAKEELGRLG